MINNGSMPHKVNFRFISRITQLRYVSDQGQYLMYCVAIYGCGCWWRHLLHPKRHSDQVSLSFIPYKSVWHCPLQLPSPAPLLPSGGDTFGFIKHLDPFENSSGVNVRFEHLNSLFCCCLDFVHKGTETEPRRTSSQMYDVCLVLVQHVGSFFNPQSNATMWISHLNRHIL